MTDQPDASQLKVRRKAKVVGFVVWLVARCIGRTVRLKREGFERIEAISEPHQGGIVVSWHGRSLLGVNLLGPLHFWALVSLSNDGEMQTAILSRFGFRIKRGSTGRGGIRAALELARVAKEGDVVAFTPDGPRGPVGVVQPGAIFLAQQSGRPILPMGLSAKPRLFLKSWDSYMIPCPFARGAAVIGNPIFVTSDATTEEKDRVALLVADAINACQNRAEELVGASSRRQIAS